MLLSGDCNFPVLLWCKTWGHCVRRIGDATMRDTIDATGMSGVITFILRELLAEKNITIKTT